MLSLPHPPSLDPQAPAQPPISLVLFDSTAWTRGGHLSQEEEDQRPGWTRQILSLCLPVSLSSSLSASAFRKRRLRIRKEAWVGTLFSVVVGIPAHGKESGAREQS